MEKRSVVEIRLLNKADLAAAVRLQALENWNQTESDWRRLLKLGPRGCFAACIDGRVIGTITTVAYGTELAWIGMMLVDPDHRRRGIATRLMHTALDHLRQLGVTTIKLDATAAGRPVYESLGFIPEAVIERWEGIAQPAPTQDLVVIDEHMRPAVYLLDRLAFGADRTQLLDSLIADCCVAPLIAMAGSDRQLGGYALARRGSKAFYVGPVIATGGRMAIALFDGMLNQLAGEKVYVDFNTGFSISPKLLAERGFVKQRELMRMRCGEESGAGTSNLIFAIAGPEIG